jgi:24-hydroxycholesterol 7alpha-hydroxylase
MDHFMSDFLEREWGNQGKCDLFSKIVETLFWSSTRALFGEKLFAPKDSYQSFRDLDSNFEMAASGVVPEFMLGNFAKSKSFLLSLLLGGKYNEKNPTNMVSIFDRVTQALLARTEESDPKNHHNWGLALLWASQANSLPSTFWTILYILNDKDIERRVREEVDAVSKVYDLDKSLEQNLEQFPYIRQCVIESIRIQSPGMIVRKVVRPMRLKSNKNVIIPAGHTLVISPYAVHRDPKNYSEPNQFIPQRWEGQKKENNSLYVPFGKGPHECPGRAFSMSEMILFLGLFFKRYPTLKLSDDFVWPTPDMRRLIGIAHPLNDVTLYYSTK